MHRMKDLYGDDADDFRPERWEGSELANIGWGFMPFHGGPRICLGSNDSSTFSWEHANIYAFRRLCADGSFLRDRPHHSNFPEPQVTTGLFARTNRAGETSAHDCDFERGWLQGTAAITDMQ